MRTSRPAQLLVLLAVFAAAGVGGTGAYLLHRYQVAAMSAAADTSALLVQSRAHLLGEELTQLVSEVDRLSGLADIDLGDQTLEPEKRVLRIARRDTVAFSIAIVILDGQGGVLWANPADARPLRGGPELVALAHARGHAAPAYSQRGIDVTAPVRGGGAIVAVVSAAGRDLFGPSLRGALRGSGYAEVVERDARGGELVVASIGHARTPLGAGGAPGTAAQEWVEAGGVRWLVTEVPAGDSGLSVRLVQTVQDLEGDLLPAWRRLVAVVVAASAIVLVGGIVLGSVLHRLDVAQAELARDRDLAAMGRTAAAIAHEVKNGLNGLSVGLDLLASRERGDDAARRSVHRIARSEIDRLREVAEDLTLFAGQPRLALGDVDAREVVRRAAALVASLAEDHGVAVHVTTASEPLLVRADASKLIGAVVNVARNGIEAMIPRVDGVLDAAAAPEARPDGLTLDVTAARDRGVARIEVADRGSGIAPEIRSSLFEPFVTTKRTGTGLGLAIVRRVVEAHGGRISAGARDGGGTVFTFELPLLGGA